MISIFVNSPFLSIIPSLVVLDIKLHSSYLELECYIARYHFEIHVNDRANGIIAENGIEQQNSATQ